MDERESVAVFVLIEIEGKKVFGTASANKNGRFWRSRPADSQSDTPAHLPVTVARRNWT